MRKLSGEKQDADSPLSVNQRTRLNDLALRIVEGALVESHPIRKVGMKTFEASDVRYFNWRLIMKNNVDATPPVSPTIESFAVSFRFENR